jgi:hypothetical protein
VLRAAEHGIPTDQIAVRRNRIDAIRIARDVGWL